MFLIRGTPRIIGILLLCIAFYCFSSSCFSGEVNQHKMIMCVDHYPPLQVIKPDQSVTGENVELTKEFVERMGLQLTFTDNTPFKRCLHLLKYGLVDIMAGLTDSSERREKFHMLLFDKSMLKAFFIRKGSHALDSFADLAGLSIASLRGARHFKKFDEANESYFAKVEVNTLESAFRMLARERVDAVITTDYYGDYLLKHNKELSDKIIKAKYAYSDKTHTYIAISKKSHFAKQIIQFEQVSKEMFDSGKFKQLIFEFRKKHPQYYYE